MTFPLDKISAVNTALALCGDEPRAVPDDGSDEWAVASAAYELAVEYMLESHNWKFATAVSVLQPTGLLPQDTWFDTAYAKPPELVHLIWVRYGDLPINYRVVGNQIYIRAFSGIPATIPTPPPVLMPLTAKFLSSTNNASGAVNATRMFMTALITFVRAGIYGGLHEEPSLEMQYNKMARGILEEAAAKSDQEEPKRAFFNHRITARRRIRGPWRQNQGSEWGGTGGPSGVGV